MKQKLKRFMAGFMAICSHWLEHSLRMVQQHLQPVRRQILLSGMHLPRIPVKSVS